MARKPSNNDRIVSAIEAGNQTTYAIKNATGLKWSVVAKALSNMTDKRVCPQIGDDGLNHWVVLVNA
jgi:hypothetical protein